MSISFGESITCPPTPRDYGYPGISVTGYSRVGDVASLPIDRADNTFQVTDTLTLIRGAHSIKIGGEFRALQQNGYVEVYGRGSDRFHGRADRQRHRRPAAGTADARHPIHNTRARRRCAASPRAASPGRLESDSQSDGEPWAALRIRFAGHRSHQSHVDVRFRDRPDGAGGDQWALALRHPAEGRRFCAARGFAWSPDEAHRDSRRLRHLLRLGHVRGQLVALFQSAVLHHFRLLPERNIADHAGQSLRCLHRLCAAAALSFISPNFVPAYVQHWNFNIQQEWHRVGYVQLWLTRDRKEPICLVRSISISPIRDRRDRIAARPIRFTATFSMTESGGNSEYQSLQVTFNRQLAAGLQMLASYTFSKSIDDTSAFLPDQRRSKLPAGQP